MWFGTWQWSQMAYFDMRAGTFGTQDLSQVGGSAALYGPSFYATPDGSAMIVADCNCLSPQPANLWYDTAADAVQARANEPAVYTNVSFDDSGSRMLVDGHLLYRTDTMALIGDAAFAAGVTAGNGVISPDGTRIYREVYDTSDAWNNNTIVDHIEVFDATSAAAGQSTFTDLGAIALPDKATGGVSAHYVVDYAGRLALDPTGAALFWAGQKGIVIVPIPSAMSGLAHTGRAHASDAARIRSAMPAGTRRPLGAQVRVHQTH